MVWNETTGYIVGGHQRVTALVQAGIKEAQVIVLHLPPKEEKELNLALNNLSGDWDYAKLRDLLTELQPTIEEAAMLGYSKEELETLMKWGEEMNAAPDSGVGSSPADKLDIYKNNAIKQIVLYFPNAEYVAVLKRLKEICEEQNFDTNSDAFLYLLDLHDGKISRPKKTA